MAKTTLDLTNAEKLMDEAYRTLKEHNGTSVDIDYDKGRTRNAGPSPERNKAAAISRDLLRMGELLNAAASEMSMAYWNWKGYPDPRSE